MKIHLKKHIRMIFGFFTAFSILLSSSAGTVWAAPTVNENDTTLPGGPSTMAASLIKVTADQTSVYGGTPVHITATWRDTGSLPLRAYIKVTNGARILADGADDIIFKTNQVQADVTEFSLPDPNIQDQISFVTGTNNAMKNSSIEFQVKAPLQFGKDFEVEVFLSSATAISNQNSSNTGKVKLDVVLGLTVETKDQDGRPIDLVDDKHPFYIEGSAAYQGNGEPSDSHVLVVIQKQDETEEVVAEYELTAEIKNGRYEFLSSDNKPLGILIPSRYREGTYLVTAYLIDGDIIGSASKEITFRKTEIDSIETAPDGELLNWDYTLSSYDSGQHNGTIQLKNYKGTSPHVTVYGKYNVGGVTYSTILDGGSLINEFPFYNARDYLLSIQIKEGVKNYNATHLFYKLEKLSSLDLSGLDTSNSRDMIAMFMYCRSLTSLDLSGLDISNVGGMVDMFQYCDSLTSLDLSDWDTSELLITAGMFDGCNSLTNLNLSDWDTSNVTDMSYMFNNCTGLTSLDLSDWDTSNVTHITEMFNNCHNLTNLNLSGWNTSRFYAMGGMFQNCGSLTTLDLTSFDTSNAVVMSYLFKNCTKLTQINATAQKWNTSKADTFQMFTNCGTSKVTLK